jgi:ubiquinone/menaquinone biosynthesis C-methylase UbiE
MQKMMGIDMLSKYIPKRINSFDVQDSLTVIDYGCGFGRFTAYFSKKVGINGKVYAVDIIPEAINNIKKMIVSLNLTNVEPILSDGYSSGLQSGIADRICAIDMFHCIDDVFSFLNELSRILKHDGVIYIDYGHQPKEQALEKIRQADVLKINVAYSQYAVLNRK